MNCRLCLTKCSKEIAVPLFPQKDEQNLIHLIAKYLYIQIHENDNYSISICQSCSQHLSEFDLFCEDIKKRQMALPTFEFDVPNLKFETITDDEEMNNCQTSNTNITNEINFSEHTAEVMDEYQVVNEVLENVNLSQSNTRKNCHTQSNDRETYLKITRFVNNSMNKLKKSLESRMNMLENKLENLSSKGVYTITELEHEDSDMFFQREINEEHKKFPELPLNSAIDIQKFDSDLENEKYFMEAIEYIKAELRTKKSDCRFAASCRLRLKKLLFSNSVLQQFTWKIPSGYKIHKFCELKNILNLFVEVINIEEPKDEAFTIDGANTYFKEFLKKIKSKNPNEIDFKRNTDLKVPLKVGSKKSRLFLKFPFTNVKDVAIFNINLGNKEYFQAAAKKLNDKLKLLPNSEMVVTRRMHLKRIMFSDTVLQKYTWKKPVENRRYIFSNLKEILRLFEEVVYNIAMVGKNINHKRSDVDGDKYWNDVFIRDIYSIEEEILA